MHFINNFCRSLIGVEQFIASGNSVLIDGSVFLDNSWEEGGAIYFVIVDARYERNRIFTVFA